jgi:hypothetical protein
MAVLGGVVVHRREASPRRECPLPLHFEEPLRNVVARLRDPPCREDGSDNEEEVLEWPWQWLRHRGGRTATLALSYKPHRR